jgi:hypothetical protein
MILGIFFNGQGQFRMIFWPAGSLKPVLAFLGLIFDAPFLLAVIFLR